MESGKTTLSMLMKMRYYEKLTLYEREDMRYYVHGNALDCIRRLLAGRFEVNPAIPPFDDPVMEVSFLLFVPSFRNSSFYEGNFFLGEGAAGAEFL